MDSGVVRKNIALLDKCHMSQKAIGVLFQNRYAARWQLHVFSQWKAFGRAVKQAPFNAIIVALDGARDERRESLSSLFALKRWHPLIRRIVLVSDAEDEKLMKHLSPVPLHGVLRKTAGLDGFHQALDVALNEVPEVGICSANYWHKPQTSRTLNMLSPTERVVLNYLTQGYSLSQIAVSLERSIKTVRAHKLKAMMKLNVQNDIDLLNAADIVLNHAPGASYAPF